jgi:hypothetical protein
MAHFRKLTTMSAVSLCACTGIGAVVANITSMALFIQFTLSGPCFFDRPISNQPLPIKIKD